MLRQPFDRQTTKRLIEEEIKTRISQLHITQHVSRVQSMPLPDRSPTTLWSAHTYKQMLRLFYKYEIVIFFVLHEVDTIVFVRRFAKVRTSVAFQHSLSQRYNWKIKINTRKNNIFNNICFYQVEMLRLECSMSCEDATTQSPNAIHQH